MISGQLDPLGWINQCEAGTEGIRDSCDLAQLGVIWINVNPATQLAATASVPICGSTAKCSIQCAGVPGAAQVSFV